jgi:hypothetical protein
MGGEAHHSITPILNYSNPISFLRSPFGRKSHIISETGESTARWSHNQKRNRREKKINHKGHKRYFLPRGVEAWYSTGENERGGNTKIAIRRI